MLKDNFYQNCIQLCAIKEQQRVLIGVSGGLDSMVLLHLFKSYKDKLGIEIGISHLNHGLRGMESDLDQKLVKEVAQQLKIPFYTDNMLIEAIACEKKQSIEECARICRYNFFKNIMKQEGYDLIATAHHFQDQSETVLIHLIRGSGLKGLKGMAYKRGLLIRPLLNITKDEIKDYSIEHGIVYREDKSNDDMDFLRNRIRQELIPVLKNYNNKIEDSLFRLSQIATVENDYLEKKTKEAIAKYLLFTEETVLLKETVFLEDEALRKRLYLKVYQNWLNKGLEYRYIEAIDQYIITREEKPVLSLPNNATLRKVRDGFLFSKENKIVVEDYEIEATGIGVYQLPGDCGILTLSYINKDDVDYLAASPAEGYLNSETISWPLIIRNRRQGDSFIPLGQDAQVKIKKCLINKKIQRKKRSEIPFLIDRKKGIIFVARIGIDNRVKLSSKESKILFVSYKD
ncbi:hypothetical protein AZF37_09170 [endosymbiont 'TC1' of Trimyema compressum]|uniref:tRNA lysidine(34) synthetase TilS n=1 Tax=endosymbiont 'TC1' of Trimyema compressum TaxID=243899 RepID=UPI0007F0FA59|nr:tRNA lysidine(34) synthetase TilS [endosymbiont 'TC1' of Trimyema compressum]AMP21290.1 hypothetical protein AZF37_09170 [endosymbiont 'TC1' of Trimyema compressum]